MIIRSLEYERMVAHFHLHTIAVVWSRFPLTYTKTCTQCLYRMVLKSSPLQVLNIFSAFVFEAMRKNTPGDIPKMIDRSVDQFNEMKIDVAIARMGGWVRPKLKYSVPPD